jgi:omega-6 fatty acid desaturase (delta-12 desaturase)
MRQLNAFRDPSFARSMWELTSTFVPFLAAFAAILFAVSEGYWIALAATPLAGLLLLRLFIIQHDCGHGSFLRKRSGNDWVGRMIGVFTLTPYDPWKYSHSRHHATTGNLDARGSGDVDMLTVREFYGRSWMRRLGYRLYRHPVVMLGVGPAYLFLLRHRLPIGLMKSGWLYWVSALGTNAVTGLILIGLALTFGALATTAVFLPVLLVAASVGVWMFYVQHQFEDAHWQNKADWSFPEAALGGSSYLHLPAPLQWFTGNIGIHHVHHLASVIPFYRLPEVLKAHPALQNVNRITAMQAFRPLLLTLWDEDQRRMISFREAARIAA